jgi:hypothetical protein
MTPRTWRPSAVSIEIGHLARSGIRRPAPRSFRASFDHLDQAEGADVRLADVDDFLRRAGLDELGQHLAAVVFRVLDLAVQLAVGEGAGAAFAELHVRFRVQLALAPEAPGVDRALAHDLAALDDDGRRPICARISAGQQAAGADADHHRALEAGWAASAAPSATNL